MTKIAITTLVLWATMVNQTMVHAYHKLPKYVFAKTTVNVRADPDKDSKLVGRVHWNDKLCVLGKVRHGKWYKVYYKKKNRYVKAEFFRKKQAKYKSYPSPSSKTFKSFEYGYKITNSRSVPQGRLHWVYEESPSGVYMVHGRYCCAVGSYYTTKIGTKIDFVLQDGKKKHILPCILADQKDNRDTVNNHRIHTDGSVIEFVVQRNRLPYMAKKMGNISYAGKQFRGRIIEIRVYQ